MLVEVSANLLQTRTCVLCVCVPVAADNGTCCASGPTMAWKELVKLVCSQVFNIYAERPDEEIKPDSWQPGSTSQLGVHWFHCVLTQPQWFSYSIIQLYRWPRWLMISLVCYHCWTKWPHLRYPNWLWKLETPPKHYGDSWQNIQTWHDSSGLTWIHCEAMSSYVKLLLSASCGFLRGMPLVRTLHSCLSTESTLKRLCGFVCICFLWRGFNLNCTSLKP